MSVRGPGRWLVVVMAVAVMLGGSGCVPGFLRGGNPLNGTDVELDVSDGRLASQLPEAVRNGGVISEPASVTIHLPGGRVLHVDEATDVAIFTAVVRGERRLGSIDVLLPITTWQGAYDDAMRWAEEWDLSDVDLFTEYFEKTMAEVAAGSTWVTTKYGLINHTRLGGPDGPMMSVFLSNKYNPQGEPKPARLRVGLSWSSQP